nr:2855_t:CDS:2 [Entrophospora candida]
MNTKAKEINEETYSRSSPSKKKIESIDTDQLEYTATTLLTYGTIVFAVVLGLGSITYMTIQQLKKDISLQSRSNPKSN